MEAKEVVQVIRLIMVKAQERVLSETKDGLKKHFMGEGYSLGVMRGLEFAYDSVILALDSQELMDVIEAFDLEMEKYEQDYVKE